MLIERRRQRSPQPVAAAHLQLDHCSQAFSMHQICLADRRGVVVATDQRDEDCAQVLAAYAPLLYRTELQQERVSLLRSLQEIIPRISHQKISVRRFDLLGQEMFLCALGDRGLRKQQGMVHAMRGLRRIFA